MVALLPIHAVGVALMQLHPFNNLLPDWNRAQGLGSASHPSPLNLSAK